MSLQPDCIALNQVETTITGHAVLTNDEKTRVRIERTTHPDDSYIYSVTGQLPLERTAITSLSNDLTGDYWRKDIPDWRDVRDGLRNVSYPSRKIRAWSRSSERAEQLRLVSPAARELADILTNNQDYRVQTATIPTFDFEQSYHYATDELFKRTTSRKLLNNLKSLDITATTVRRLNAYFSNEGASKELAQTVEKALGLSNDELQEIESGAILNELDAHTVTELTYRLHHDLFVGFPKRVEFDSDGLHGGGDDPTVLIREQDVPLPVMTGYTNVLVATGGLVKSAQRKFDRNFDLERHRVTFFTQAPRYVALPRLVWKNQGGTRSFMFPKSEFDAGWQQIARPSSLAGAALAAYHFGKLHDIDYVEQLWRYTDRYRTRLQKNRRKEVRDIALAGLFPLVLNHRQDELLDDDYFTSIEEALE